MSIVSAMIFALLLYTNFAQTNRKRNLGIGGG
jgi:hypothetical protein